MDAQPRVKLSNLAKEEIRKLIQGFQAGDKEAIETLVTLINQRIQPAVQKRFDKTPIAHRINELIIEAWSDAFENRHNYNINESMFDVWVYRIALRHGNIMLSSLVRSISNSQGNFAAVGGQEWVDMNRHRTELIQKKNWEAWDNPSKAKIIKFTQRKESSEELVFPKAGVDFDTALLLPYMGQWIAWSPDGRSVAAHAEDPAILEKLLADSGLDVSQCILDYVDEGTEV